MKSSFFTLPLLCAALLLPAAEIRLETGRGTPIHVLTPGDESRLGVRIVNDGAAKERFSLEYSLADFDGSELGGGRSAFVLASGETEFVPLPKPDRYGVRSVTVNLTGTVTGTSSKRMSYCYMVPTGPTPGMAKGFLFGICVHTQRFPPAEQEREAMAAAWCGAKVFREDIGWCNVERRRGEWDWSAYDRLIALYEKYGLELQGIYAWVPEWAAPEFNRNGCPEAWREYIRRFAVRYRDRVRYMEVWNEPDINTFGDKPERYLQLMRIAYRETRIHAPGITVMTGGFSGMVTTARQTAFVRRILDQGKGSYDAIAFHGHGSLSSYLTHLEPLLAAKREFGIAAPWYANETAEPSNWSGEEGQALTLFKKLLVSWSRGAIGYNWYDLRNDGDNPEEAEHNYGMLTQEFYPKPVYGVYNMLAGVFREAKFIRNAKPGQSRQAYLFRDRQGAFLLPAWNDEPGETLFAVSGGNRASRIDLFGNETPLSVLDGITAFAVGDRPAILRTAVGEEPVFQGKFLSADGAFNLVSGEERKFELELANPTDSTLRFQLKLILPPGLSGLHTTADLRLAPGEERRISWPLQTTRDFHSLPDRPQTVGIELSLTAGKHELWHGTLRREVRTVTRLPQQGFAGQPDFVLNRSKQVLRLVPAAPENEPLYWKGPRDLSAAVRLGRNGNTLLLRVEVTDDVHCQPRRGVESWMGDNIQLALQLPGQSGLWEIGLTRLADGEPETWIWLAPTGYSPEKAAPRIKLVTSRDETTAQTVYHAELPFETIGLTETTGKQGFRFNLLVNDNDGKGRNNCIAVAPGIAESKSPGRYPTVCFR